MLDCILPMIRCPFCAASGLLRLHMSAARCPACASIFPIDGGILDLLGDTTSETITPFQRIMQTPFVVSIYESQWRRVGYFLASSRSFKDELRTVLNLQERVHAGRLLDLACGTGVFTRPLARQAGGVVVGLDISWPMLRRARRLLEREGIENVVLVRGSALRLPFAEEAFSSINCCGGLHLFARPADALREMVRVLCPKGYLSVQTTIRPARSGGFAFFLERFIRFGFFEEKELRCMMDSHGLQILESQRHRISFTFLARRESHGIPLRRCPGDQTSV